MSRIRRDEFIEYFVKYVRRELEKKLPEQDFEMAMLDRAKEILGVDVEHLQMETKLKWPG